MVRSNGYVLKEEAKEILLDVTDVKRKEPNFANAREVRNILEHMIMCQNLRALSSDDKEIGLIDAKKYVSDMGIPVSLSGDDFTPKILTADEELEDLIGLNTVKRLVKKIRAYAKRNIENGELNLHMCFYGNPGTGKTEVGRIISRILYDAGVLPEAKFVETDAHGLIGKYVGETAPKTEAKIADAMGGVLFIDEAYSLCGSQIQNGSTAGYGDEAIAVLLKKMEDSRGKFCVVFAGYRDQMKRMLSSNPGLESRVQFTLDFPDYTREELGEIAVRFASKKKYVLEKEALERILDVAEYYRSKPNFANARTVRNILDQVIMNQNLRTEDEGAVDDTIILQDVEDYISDENIVITSS
jgi:SpoVK/Ycf46/Vps4 family AAA+-type ATPase